MRATSAAWYDLTHKHDRIRPTATSDVLYGIQFLRGMAVLLVVASHANGIMRKYVWGSPLPTLFEVSRFSVAVFFIISGVIVTIVSLKTDGSARLSPKEFLNRRFLRIVPIMWLCVISYNLLSAAGTGTIDWIPALHGMVLWPLGEIKPNVLWSLRHELLFYSIFGLTLLTARRRVWLLVAWCMSPIFLSIALAIWPNAPWAVTPVEAELVSFALGGASTGANLQFGVGVLLGLATLRKWPPLAARLPYGLALTSLTFLAGAVLMEVYKYWPLAATYRAVVITVLGAGIVCVGLSVANVRSRANSVGLLLGNASYSIYLFHNTFVLIAMEAAKRLAPELPHLLLWGIFVVAGVVGGVITHRFVEAPLVTYLAHRFREPVPVIAQPTA